MFVIVFVACDCGCVLVIVFVVVFVIVAVVAFVIAFVVRLFVLLYCGCASLVVYSVFFVAACCALPTAIWRLQCPAAPTAMGSWHLTSGGEHYHAVLEVEVWRGTLPSGTRG